jgi:ectoine hydroxylase-related dioxygenase (phytanoyl-CoA dioxygenase family)
LAGLRSTGATAVEHLVATDDIAAFQRDGVICLRGGFAEWLEPLARGVARNLREPGPMATDNLSGGETGRFFDDYCNWQRIPEYRDFVLNSPAAGLAARIMGSRTAQFFHEHLLIKEPGTARRTPWHHDLPYYGVQGQMTVSIWLSLDPVPRAVCPEFIAGSHRWDKLYYPRLFKSDTDYDYGGGEYETIPDIEAARDSYDILSWDLEPGDALLFSFLTVHGAPPNLSDNRRRGFSTRWLGDDVTYAERPGTTSPPFPGIGLDHGERMREDWFPVLWRD